MTDDARTRKKLEAAEKLYQEHKDCISQRGWCDIPDFVRAWEEATRG